MSKATLWDVLMYSLWMFFHFPIESISANFLATPSKLSRTWAGFWVAVRPILTVKHDPPVRWTYVLPIASSMFSFHLELFPWRVQMMMVAIMMVKTRARK